MQKDRLVPKPVNSKMRFFTLIFVVISLALLFIQGKIFRLVRWFIIGGEPERASIADLMFCHGTQTLGFVTVCCSMSMVSNFVQPFCLSRKLLCYTHAWTKLHNKLWAKSLALMSVSMHGPYLKRTQLLCMIWRYSLWAACPSLSWSTVAFHQHSKGL